MTYTVVTKHLSKSFDGHRVVDDLDLAIRTGSVYALLGPNGAGKTTTVRMLATLVRPDAGTALVAGRDLLGDPRGVRGEISLTGQYAAVDDVLTGRENLEMMARLLHLPRGRARRRAVQLLAQFELLDAADRRVRAYSGGMRRRLDLAISMINRPRLLFLDEPTTGLDPPSREMLWSTVRGLVDDGVTVLLTTQYLEEADQLADTVGVLTHGRMVAEGTPDELKRRVGGDVVRLHFSDQAILAQAQQHVEAVVVKDRLRTLDVLTDGSAETVRRLLDALDAAGAPADKVSTHRPSLDDVFKSLTAERAPAARREEMV